jgi:hypothetical protein
MAPVRVSLAAAMESAITAGRLMTPTPSERPRRAPGGRRNVANTVP